MRGVLSGVKFSVAWPPSEGAGEPSFSIVAAQALYSGIFTCGSMAGFVSWFTASVFP